MKEEETWKTIKINGLSRYQISNCRNVRIKITKELIPIENGVVSLLKFNKREMFLVENLRGITFDKNFKEINQYQKYVEENYVFSQNEDDYGTGVNAIHWQELKKEITKIKFLKANEEKNLI